MKSKETINFGCGAPPPGLAPKERGYFNAIVNGEIRVLGIYNSDPEAVKFILNEVLAGKREYPIAVTGLDDENHPWVNVGPDQLIKYINSGVDIG